MASFPEEYIHKIYAGWLSKIIGVRLGAPTEGWTYDKIRNTLGKPDDYIVGYKNFAADDDTNGPIFLLRALEDKTYGKPLEASDVATALLNYAPYEHGFFWWGGYGISTEHTAYLNLRSGVPAPRSGSVEQNGLTIAEQIGGQIFIDTWGLVAPGDPDLAAELAEKAASVTHGNNGVFGGVFIAAAISEAFVERDIIRIINKALGYIPKSSEYSRVVNAVMDFYFEDYRNDPSQACWENAYQYVFENYGYDKYPGVCHIIPNAAVIIIALLYGQGDFSRTINICNCCGWDTDCNVGNVATIIGVHNGLDAIGYEKWRKPINDLLICSSVVGSLNIMDIPYGAAYIIKLAADIAGQDIPDPWKTIIAERTDSCHFEFPGSTHAMRVRIGASGTGKALHDAVVMTNSNETAYSGERSLKVTIPDMNDWDEFLVYKKTYYEPEDFNDGRYDPSFSPLVYSGQTIYGAAFIPDYACELSVQLYAHDTLSNEILRSDFEVLNKGEWKRISWQIPYGHQTLIDEIGFIFNVRRRSQHSVQPSVFVDDLYAEGQADYCLDFDQSKLDIWNQTHITLSQFTKLKGNVYLDNGCMHLSASDFAEVYTGSHRWRDYDAEFELTPLSGQETRVNFRVQGAMRSYAVALIAKNKIALLKNSNGYSFVQSRSFMWRLGDSYKIAVRAQGANLMISVNGQEMFSYVDDCEPYLFGSIGYSATNGSHLSSNGFRIRPVQEQTR